MLGGKKVPVPPSAITLVQVVPQTSTGAKGVFTAKTTVGTNEGPISPTDHIFHRLTILASYSNTVTVYIGGQGSQPMEMPAGASITLYDVSPNWIYASASTTGQILEALGYGFHTATETGP